MTTADPRMADLRAFVKARASLDGATTFVYLRGEIYHNVEPREATADYPATGTPQNRQAPLFLIEGFSSQSAAYDEHAPRFDGSRSPGYCFRLSEVIYYLDPATGQVLDDWMNPMIPVNADGTGGLVSRRVNVMHMHNSPMNVAIGPEYMDMVKPTYLDSRTAMFTVTMSSRYPNPLADPKYGRFSSGDTYQGLEIALVTVDRAQLEDESVQNATSMRFSWTRLAPYLPWMHMGAAPGRLSYVATGWKVPGVAALPSRLVERVKRDYPSFLDEPTGPFVPGSVNSWKVFKRELDEGRYVPTPVP